MWKRNWSISIQLCFLVYLFEMSSHYSLRFSLLLVLLVSYRFKQEFIEINHTVPNAAGIVGWFMAVSYIFGDSSVSFGGTVWKILHRKYTLDNNKNMQPLERRISFWATTSWQSSPLPPLFVIQTHAWSNSKLQTQNTWLSHFLCVRQPTDAKI